MMVLLKENDKSALLDINKILRVWNDLRRVPRILVSSRGSACKSEWACASVAAHQLVFYGLALGLTMFLKLRWSNLKDLITLWLVVLTVWKWLANSPTEPSQGRVAGEEGRLDVPRTLVRLNLN
jgi:hypothetical protein